MSRASGFGWRVTRFAVRVSAIIPLLFWNSVVLAQPRIETSQFGAYVHGNLNLHSANFQTLPGVPSCCPRYENGSGIGFGIGGFYDFVSASPFALEFRLGYSTLNATLKTDEFTTVLDASGNSAQGEFEHSVQASVGMLNLTPLAKYQFLPGLDILAGPTFGWIVSNAFTEKETLLEPNFGTFEDGLRVRNNVSGSTPNAEKLYLGGTAGFQYHLPLNASGTVFAVPEVLGTYGITPLVSGMNWRASSLTGGIALEYRLFAPIPPPVVPPPPPVPAPPPPAVPKPPALTATLGVTALDSAKTEVPLKELVIEDYIRTQYRPLLNYIFFDSGSAKIPDRYNLISLPAAQTYDFKRFSDDETLPLYYEVLNIIGKRMEEYPNARLTIVGCSGKTETNAAVRELSRERGEAVSRYLHTVWNIDPARLQVEARGLPEKPSNASDSDGEVENRRAELYSNVPQILEPIFTTDTARVPKPPVIRYLPGGVVPAGVAHWDVQSMDGPNKVKDFSGSGGLTPHLDWDLTQEHESDLAKLQSIHATLVVDDSENREAKSTEVSVPVRHFTLLDKHRVGSTDTIISRYSLILFDFDRSDLGSANRRIADFVKARVSDRSKVQILGYTDRMGSTEYNQTLSAARAQATERYIGLRDADVRGLGRSSLLYDNSLPEGRFYSRTVTVVVTTPTAR